MSDLPPVTDAVPVLPVADLVRSLAFYERLGFEVLRNVEGEAYAILAFEDAEVHLREDPSVDGQESASGVYLRVPFADVVHARWTAVGAPEIAPLTDQPYGVREFATEDPDGNLWRVGAFVLDAPLPVGEPEVDGLAAGAPDSAPPAEPDPNAQPGPAPEPDGVTPTAAQAAPEPLVDGERNDGASGTPDWAWYGIIGTGHRCAGCGLEPGELPARALGAEVRDEVHAFGNLLRIADDIQVRVRPQPDTWSALEYAVHVRDTLTLFAERIMRTLREHDPQLPGWDHIAAIEEAMANESDVDAVADDLGRNASVLSQVLREVTDDDWDRAAHRDDERLTIELMARFVLHEVVHHHLDAQRSLAAASPN